MDAERFDTLTRTLTVASSRRRALGVVFSGALSVLDLAHSDDVAARGKCKPSCGACQTCTKGKCHKSKQRCKRGECVAIPPGTVPCGGVCVDLASDPRNCGSCGKRCSVNETCSGGSCRCDVVGVGVCPIPNATCCAGGAGCTCSPTDPLNIFDTITCRNIPPADCPPERTCNGLQCGACCPVGTTCEPSTGRCLQ